jgi:hypothetical protein
MELHPLFEELQAFDPRYQHRYPTLRDAAQAAGVMDLFADYLRTQDGHKYAREVATAPDVLGATREAAEAADRLPYTLDTIGLTHVPAEVV